LAVGVGNLDWCGAFRWSMLARFGIALLFGVGYGFFGHVWVVLVAVLGLGLFGQFGIVMFGFGQQRGIEFGW
jgi:hypothetical protein